MFRGAVMENSMLRQIFDASDVLVAKHGNKGPTNSPRACIQNGVDRNTVDG